MMAGLIYCQCLQWPKSSETDTLFLDILLHPSRSGFHTCVWKPRRLSDLDDSVVVYFLTRLMYEKFLKEK
jgi:hypothetical protein